MWFFKHSEPVPEFELVKNEKLRVEEKIATMLKKHARRSDGQVDGMVEVIATSLDGLEELVTRGERRDLTLFQRWQAWMLKRWINGNRKLLKKLRKSANEPA